MPRRFLTAVLQGCVDRVRENNVAPITAQHMKIISSNRPKKKNRM